MTEAALQWAKRLTGVSVLLLLIGVVSYYNAMPSMYEQLDPAQNNMLELQPGESGQVEIATLGEYVALRLEDDDSANLRMIDSAGQEDEGSAPTALDITRTGEDGSSYVAVRVFRSSAAGEYTLPNDGSTTLWVVDDVSGFKRQIVFTHHGTHAFAPAAGRFHVGDYFWFIHFKACYIYLAVSSLAI